MNLQICANCKNFWRDAHDKSRGVCNERRNYITSLGPKKVVKPLDSCSYFAAINDFANIDIHPDMVRVMLIVQALHQTLHACLEAIGDAPVLEVILAITNFNMLVVERFAENVPPDQANLLRRIAADTLMSRLVRKEHDARQ